MCYQYCLAGVRAMVDAEKELNFDFDNKPKRFIDVESGEHIDIYADTVQENYQKAVADYFQQLRMKCAQYKIKYVAADITKNFEKILTTYLVERQKFA